MHGVRWPYAPFYTPVAQCGTGIVYAYILFHYCLCLPAPCFASLVRKPLGKYVWFPGSFIALGHSCPTNSLVLSLQSDWALVTRGTGVIADGLWTIIWMLAHQDMTRWVTGCIYVFIKCQCMGKTSFGVSNCSKLGVPFPRVISPKKSLFDKNWTIVLHETSRLLDDSVFGCNGQSPSGLEGHCVRRMDNRK